MRLRNIPASRLYATETGNGTSSASTPTEPGNGPPRVTVPATGRYRVQWGVGAGAASGAITVYLYKGATQVTSKGGLANSVNWIMYSVDLYLRAGEILSIRGQNASSTSTIYAERQIQLTPLF